MSLVFGVSLLEANLDGIITNSEIRGAVISATFAFFSEFFQDKITTENNFIDILKDIIEEIKSEFIEEFTIKGINDYYKSKQ